MRWIKKIFHWRFFLGILSFFAIISLLLSYLGPYSEPKINSFVPFFALGYNFIVLGNTLLLLFWIFLQSKWKWFFIIALLLGGTLHFRSFSFGSNATNNNKRTELHVMSYNVRLFDLYASDRKNNYLKKEKIFQFLRDKQPEVVCFQEFYKQDKPTKFVTKDSIIQILHSVDSYERYSHRITGRQNFGVAIFSKLPIIEKGNVTFDNQEKSFNYCIYTDIVKEQDTFRIYNIHLQSIRFNEDEYELIDNQINDSEEKQTRLLKLMQKVRKAYPLRAKQAIQVNKHIQNSPYPVIVCGDFNDTPMSYVYDQFSQQLTDAFRNTSFGIGATYAGKLPIGRIDYIFHSSELDSRDFNIQEEELSDHYAIDCTVFKK
ncbi:MAG TPA: hypothetical protein EYG86_00515 [Crocinitomicaceae bacterium]|nr:hypothetical protein [Crocinitomicaceae bacterium]